MTTQNPVKISLVSEQNKYTSLLQDLTMSILDGDFDEFKKLADGVLEKEVQEAGDKLLILIVKKFTFKSLEMLEYLLKKGTSPNVADKNGNTPLHFLLENNCTELENINQQKFDIKYKMTCLLIEYGAKLDQKNNNGDLPQHVGLFKNNKDTFDLKILPFLITKGIDLNAPDKNEHTLLLKAIANGTPAGVLFLLEHGVSANPYDKDINTPLHYAAYSGKLETIDTLIKFKANINSPNSKGVTPLLVAFRYQQFGSFQFLLECGASIVALDENGEDLFLKEPSPSFEIQALYEQKKLKMSLQQNSNKSQIARL